MFPLFGYLSNSVQSCRPPGAYHQLAAPFTPTHRARISPSCFPSFRSTQLVVPNFHTCPLDPSFQLAQMPLPKLVHCQVSCRPTRLTHLAHSIHTYMGTRWTRLAYLAESPMFTYSDFTWTLTRLPESPTFVRSTDSPTHLPELAQLALYIGLWSTHTPYVFSPRLRPLHDSTPHSTHPTANLAYRPNLRYQLVVNLWC